MYQRQWFSVDSHPALSSRALDVETYVRKRNYSKALSLCQYFYDNIQKSKEKSYWIRQIMRIYNLVNYRLNSYGTVKVWFEDFWLDFNPHNNEILNLFKYACACVGLVLKVTPDNPNILITSCFSSNKSSCYPNLQATKFVYLGENVRPSFEHIDYSLTFDLDSYMGRNLYLPLWFLRLEKYAVFNSSYEPIKFSLLCNSNYNYAGRPDNSVVYIGNNMTPLRQTMINLLKSNGFSVDIFGSQTRPVKNKSEVMKNYKYSLCFENSYYPGYITEKIFDAYSAGTIPLYWGSESLPPINESSFLRISSNTLNDGVKSIGDKSPLHSVNILDEQQFTLFENKIQQFLMRLLFDLYI